MILSDIVGQVHGLITDNLPPRTGSTPSGWRTLNCPMCTDRRHRGGVKIEGTSIGYNCFNCGYSTRWEPGSGLGHKYRELAKRLGASDTDIHRVNLALMQFRGDLEGFTSYQHRSLPRFQHRELPSEARLVADLDDDHPVKQYAQQRGVLGLYPLLHFDFADIKERFKWRDRLVVPFTYDDEIVGWTGRHVNPPDKTVPKYLSEQPEGYVFGLDRVSEHHKITVVVEGVLDAILINGVSPLGNSVSSDQIKLINQLGTTPIVCPDRDAAGKELIAAALENGWRVSFPPWEPGIKDVGDAVQEYGRLLTMASIVQHSIQNPTKIRVKAKML